MIRLNTLGWWLWQSVVLGCLFVAGLIWGEWTLAAITTIPFVLSLAVVVRLARLARSRTGDGFRAQLPGSGRFARWLYGDTLDSD